MAEVLVPLFAMIFLFGIPTIAVIFYLVLNNRKQRALIELSHKERMTAIERGMDPPALPEGLIEGRRKKKPRRTSLLPGLVWFFVGIAIMISMQSIADEEALLGLVPTAIGAAYLLYYFLEGKKIEAAFREQELAERPAGNGSAPKSISGV